MIRHEAWLFAPASILFLHNWGAQPEAQLSDILAFEDQQPFEKMRSLPNDWEQLLKTIPCREIRVCKGGPQRLHTAGRPALLHGRRPGASHRLPRPGAKPMERHTLHKASGWRNTNWLPASRCRFRNQDFRFRFVEYFLDLAACGSMPPQNSRFSIQICEIYS